MSRTLKLLLACSAALMLALAVAACGDSSSSSDDTVAGGSTTAEATDAKLRVGVSPGFATEQLLEASGEMAEIDYDVEFQENPAAGPEWLELARAGETDISEMLETPILFGQTAKTPAKAIAALEWMKPGESVIATLVPEDSPIKSIEDIKGKSISALEGNYQQYYLAKLLESAGLTLSDVSMANLPLAEAAASYEAGQIDVFNASDPYLTPMLQAGNREIGGSADVIAPERLYWVATDDVLDSRSAQVEDFLEHIRLAEEWADENPEKWGPILGKALGVDAKLGKEIAERRETNYVEIDSEVIASIQDEADLFVDLGILPEAIDVSEMFEARFSGPLSGEAG